MDNVEFDVPDNWTVARIDEVVDLVNGFAFKPSHWQDRGLPIIRIQNLNNASSPYNFCSDAIPEKFRVRHGDLLFAWSGTPGTSFGAHVWNGKDAWLNQHIFRVDFDRRHLATEFLRFAINQNLQRYINVAHGGAGLAHITKGRFESSTLLLAPFSEQRRIVAKIDALQARSRKAREALEAVPPLLEQFRRSVLAAAFRGDLTANWREQNLTQCKDIPECEELCSTPETWSWMSLDSFCEHSRNICYGVIKLGEHVADGVPCLRTSDVRLLRIATENVKRIAPQLSGEYRRTVLRGGEVLVNVRGTLGGVASVPVSMAGWNVSREVAVVPLVGVNPDFVALWIASPTAQSWLDNVSKGVAYTGINIADLRRLPVPVPSAEEQLEIINKVNSLLGSNRVVEAVLRQVDTEISTIDQSILAKAFRGELVPQDPNDEPASVLLERIQAERANGTNSKPTGGRGKRTSKVTADD